MATTMTDVRPQVDTRAAGNVMREIIVAGAIAGMIGGALMGMWAMFSAAAMGLGFWMPMQLIDGVWAGVRVILGGAGVSFAGFITHMMFAAMAGIVFALILKRDTRAWAALGSGLVYGIAVWAVMYFWGLPWLNRTMADRVAMMSGQFFFEHLLFGMGVALAPWLRRSLFRTA